VARKDRFARRAQGSYARRSSRYVSALAIGSLSAAAWVHAAPTAQDAQLSLLKNLEDDDFRMTGYLASRGSQSAPDYRIYVGMGYKSELGSLAKMTSSAFYGTGTYDGLNASAGALPEDVRATGALLGNWLGADWKVESHPWAGHTFSAGLEYREQLPVDVLDLNVITQRQTPFDATLPERRVGMVTQNDVALASGLALKVRMRYDEHDGAFSTVAPRVELAYKAGETSKLNAVFDQTAASPLTQQRATHGLEVGMERNVMGGARGRVSYAWQQTLDGLTGTNDSSLDQRVGKLSLDVPILPKRLSTSFELQYIDLAGALVGDRRSDFVIGNLTLASAALTGDTHVTVGMRNVFGTQAGGTNLQSLPAIPTDGRSVSVDFSRKL
jgi:hypothetical protein